MRLSRRLLHAGLIVVVAAGLAACGSDDEKSDVKTEPTNSSTAGPSNPAVSPTPESAAGKPCVALADPLPEGAPDVPIKVGPPPTELVVEDLEVGTGAEAVATSTVNAHYIGVSCSTGRIFDASYKSGQPIEFPLSGVIQGWSTGLVGMKVGGKRLLGIPAEMAYGSSPPEGAPIAPDEALWFVVELEGVS